MARSGQVILWYIISIFGTTCLALYGQRLVFFATPGLFCAQQNKSEFWFHYHTHTHTLTQTHLMALCPGLPRWAGARKIKPIWIILKQETVSGSGISWSICKSAPRSRQITTPAPHHSVFTGRMLFLTPNQQRWRQVWFHNHIKIISWQYLLCYAPIHAQHDISVANKVFSNFNSATLPVFSWSWSRV